MERPEETNIHSEKEEYADYTISGLWPRIGAGVLDSLFISFTLGAISVFNIISVKNVWLLLIVSLAGLLYKPFMEYRYGATFGKQIMKIKVIRYDFTPITIKQAVLRSVFQLTANIFSMIALLLIITSGEADQIQNFTDYSNAITSNTFAQQTQIVSYLIIIDYIFVFFDKYLRCLHDRIAETYVIKN